LTTVINLFGEPGVGKSTLAAEIYSEMKKMGLKVELVREFAKELAWEGKKIGPFDQMAIIGEQIRRESSLFGKVDYIITDSPALLGAFYMEYNHNQTYMTDMVKKYLFYSTEKNVVFKNYLIDTHKEYVQDGRYETEDEAKKIKSTLIDFLNNDYVYEIYDNISSILEPKNKSLAW